MEIGKLNRRITIVTNGARVADGIGGFTQAAGTTVDTWCSAKHLNQRENLSYGLEMGTASYKFTFRYEAGKALTQVKRLIYESRNFRIIGVNELDENKSFIQVIANEETN